MHREDNNMKAKITSILIKIRENFLLQLLTCILLSSIVLISYVVLSKVIGERQFHKYTIIDEIKLVNSIEQTKVENNDLIIKGYAFLLQKNSSGNAISVFLRSINTGKEIWLDMNQMTRQDINSYYQCEYDYSNSGFEASTELANLVKDDIYEVIINVDYTDRTAIKDSRTTVSAKKFIMNEKLYSYNPDEFVQPSLDIESNLLKEVFTSGKLCFYKEDIGMYVYEYNGNLYWIANNDVVFNQEGKTYIIYHLYTTQVDRLPEEQIKYNYFNSDFVFEQYEYRDEATSPYRVAIREIPKGFSISYITTGVYDVGNQKSVWTKNFHLDAILN